MEKKILLIVCLIVVILKLLGVSGYIIVILIAAAAVLLGLSLLFMNIRDKLDKRQQKKQQELDDQKAFELLEEYIEKENFICFELYMEKHPLTICYSSELAVQKDLEKLSQQSKQKLLNLMKDFSQKTKKQDIPVHVEYFLKRLS